jgi:phosphonopyruvate decarboxylase
MLNAVDFLEELNKSGVTFATGVPDSLLSEICKAIEYSSFKTKHIAAVNEGGAIGMAIGHYLSSGQLALVYMQNSGLGNSINPLVSLADPKVYGIPMVLIVGWRGALNEKGNQIPDEPQHVKQGLITLDMLDVLGVPYKVIDGEGGDSYGDILKFIDHAYKMLSPIALVIKKNTFESTDEKNIQRIDMGITREQALKEVENNITTEVPVVITTGMSSREFYELREIRKKSHDTDFLVVGGMGHASQIAVGIARNIYPKKIICIDGDGAALMHLGALTISSIHTNFVHILINNNVHDSVGGQNFANNNVDFSAVAQSCGYGSVSTASTLAEIGVAMRNGLIFNGSVFINIKCKAGHRNDLGRPPQNMQSQRDSFIKFLKGSGI